MPQEEEHSVRPPLLQTNGNWVSGRRSVRGGIRAFLFGADPRGRVLSGIHRSEDWGENTDEEEEEEEEEEGKEESETGGSRGGSSTDTVRGPGREDKHRWTLRQIKKERKGRRKVGK